MILRKTINIHNLTKAVATVKAVLFVNVPALTVCSMAVYYCYSG